MQDTDPVMKEVKITLRIVYDHIANDDPHRWNWNELLDLYPHELIEVVEIEEVEMEE